MLGVLHGPLVRRSVDAVRPIALGLSATVAALAVTAPAALAASAATTPRAYEMVSPTDKVGNDISWPLRSSDDGDHVGFVSFGGIADTPANVVATYYSAHRSATGWNTLSLSPPNASIAPSLFDALYPSDLSDDLRTAYYTVPGFQDTSFSTQDRNLLDDVFVAHDAVATWLSPSLTLPDATPGSDANSLYAGRSADGSHVLVESSKQLLPSVPGGHKQVYDSTGGKLRLVSILPADVGNPPAADAVFGGGRTTSSTYEPPDARAISTDGSRIHFGRDGQLYVRVDGKTTELISASRRTGDPRGPVAGANARFMGASNDGRTVVFTADKPLTDDASAAIGLYMYRADDDTLTLLAEGPANSILGTIRTTADGARVYFASTQALAPGATLGKANIYVAGDVGRRFIASLPTGSGGELWQAGEFASLASSSRDGRTIAFATSESLGGAQTGGRGQIYVYNVDTGLKCASCPPDGAATGDATLRDVSGNQQIQPHGVADDGTVFFESPDQLTTDDTDDKIDVYAYDGAAHLISVGTKTDTHVVDNSRDGRDVFLRTRDGLVPDDDDGGFADIYDARIGGGFPVKAPPPACAGEACRGPQTSFTADPPPASLTATDADGPGKASPQTPTTFTVGKISASARASWAATGKVKLTVRVSDDAAVTAKAKAKIGKRTTTVASASSARAGAGTIRLTLSLSASAKRALKRTGRLDVRLTVTCSDATAPARATVVLRTKKKAGR